MIAITSCYRLPIINDSKYLTYYGSKRFISVPAPKKPENFFKKGMAAYENYLQKNWPTAYKYHRIVVDGTKSSVADVKSYYYIRRDLNSGKVSLSELSREQLQTYIQTRNEFGKLITIIIFATLPFAFYVLVFSIIFFPKYVLTRHFWTQEQKRKFWIESLNASANSHFQPLIEQLPKQSKDFPLNMKEIKSVNVKPLKELDFKQLYHLSRVHRFFPLNPRSNLEWRANALKHLDEKMQQNLGSLDNMNTDELYTQMHLRCLNFNGLSDDECRQTLRNWIKNSSEIASNSSLYLHAPVLLQYKKKSVNG